MIKLDDLGKYLKTPPIIEGISTNSAYHEGLKAQLYVFGFKEGFYPVLEATPAFFKKNQRIDCVFCDREDKKIKVAIELDRYIKKRSVEKLISLEDNVQKIIISYGRSSDAFYKAKYRTKKIIGDVNLLRLNLYFLNEKR